MKVTGAATAPSIPAVRRLSMRFLLRLAFSELSNQRTLSLFFIANLTVGLLSFVLLDSFKQSLSHYLTENSQAMMAADIRVYTRRAFSPAEEILITKRFAPADIAKRSAYMTMSTHATRSKLVQVNVVDGAFPLYGELLLKDLAGNNVSITAAQQELQRGKVAAIYQELAYFYDISETNPTILINDIPYTVKYIITKDVGVGFDFGGIVSKIYVAQVSFAQEVLEQFGVTLRSYRYLRMPPDASLTETEAVTLSLREQLGNQAAADDASPPVIRAHHLSGARSAAILSFIARDLSLIAMIAIFLSGLASAYLFRTFVHRRFKELAILQSLGMPAQTAFSLSIIELMMISSCAALLTITLGYFLVPVVPVILAKFMPEGFAMSFSLKSIAITFVMSIFGVFVFCLPILSSIRRFSLAFLFSDEVKFYGSSKLSFILSSLAIPVFFYIMALWVSGSLKFGSIFTGFFFVFVGLTFLAGWGVLKLIERISPYLKFPFSFVVRSFLHYRVATLFYFAAISLSVMLITLVLQIERTIADEAALPKGYVLPTFFMFNIVEETASKLEITAEELGHPISDTAPMLGGRLTAINNVPIQNNMGDTDREDWRQEERERVNRRVNMSFRTGLLASETYHSGTPFTPTPPSADEPVELSLEMDYAKDLKLKLGDTLSISMLDVPYTFTGKLVNLRRVKWNTFEPNFFIVVAPGVLENLPKTYVATLRLTNAAPSAGEYENKKAQLQADFARRFPNLSIIDIEKVITYVLSIVSKLVLLVKGLALFSLVLGVFLLFSVVNYQVRERRKEINMLKVIGSKLRSIQLLVLGEYLFLGVLSIVLGLFTSVLLYFLVTIYIFENEFFFHPGLLLNIGMSVLAIIALVSYLAAASTLRQKPIMLMKSAQ